MPEIDSNNKYATVQYVDESPFISYDEPQEITAQEKQNVFTTLGIDPIAVYNGGVTPPASLGNNGDLYLQTVKMQQAPDVIYETDGTTGLLGHNNSSLDNNWQLENLSLSGYTRLKCYFSAGSATGDSRTPSVVVDIPLDDAAVGPTGYLGSTMTPLPFNRNREYMVTCAVDTTKTKFQVLHQNTLWDITTSDANSNARYCYKIEGWY